MAPDRDGGTNQGHACVKGRFAYGYATHRDRIVTPLVRTRITDPWREATWDEAIAHAASEFRRDPVAARQGFNRWHYFFEMHQRGDLPGAEARARRIRKQ